MRAKLITAKAAAHDHPEYEINVSALEKVIPKDLPASEISVRLGTTWIPQEDIQQFMMELLTPSSYAECRLKVRYTAYNGDWFIENKSSDVGNVKADSTYGTKRASAYRIIEDTLNLRDTRIFDYVYDEHNNKKAVLNHKETTAAQAKQEVIKQAFQDWIWKDPERRNRLVRYYNDTSVLPQEIVTAVEDCGFFESIPLWAVTLIGGLFITVLSFIMIMSVYGRFFKLYLYTAIAPVPLSSFAGEPSQSVGRSFIKSYCAVCLEGAIIVLACIIFSVFAASPPVVNPDAAAVTMVWGYIGELVFNMLVLVGAVKMADRVVREMMGL